MIQMIKVIKNPAIISLVILIVLIGGFGLKKVLSTPRGDNGSYFGKGNSFCINNICIDKAEEKYWVDNGRIRVPASEGMVKPFLTKLGELGLGELASGNKDKFASMGFSESDKTTVEMNGKKLIVGGLTERYDGTFVRPEGVDLVYRIEVILDKSNLNNFEYWQKRDITNLPVLQVTKVTVKSEKSERQWEKDKDGKWEDDKLVATAANLRAVDILGEAKPLGPQIELEIKTEGETVKFWVGKDESNKKNPIYWATSDNSFYYKISSDDFVRLTSKLK